MIDIMQSRKAIEQQQLDEDANPTRKSNSVQHHLTARTLSNLFDERKTAKTEQDMRELAKEYQFDFDVSAHAILETRTGNSIRDPQPELVVRVNWAFEKTPKRC